MSGHPDDKMMRAIVNAGGDDSTATARADASTATDGRDSKDPAQRRQTLTHVLECRACRDRLVEIEPGALFALLSLRQPPTAALDDLSRRVSAAIDAEQRPVAFRRFAAVASLAASVVLAVGLGFYLDRDPAIDPDPFRADLDRYLERLDRDSPVPGIELISSPGDAQVVDLEVGDTQVVMIFDKALDL